MEYVQKVRDAMSKRADYAQKNQDAILMINVDSMDQNKTNVPWESL